MLHFSWDQNNIDQENDKNKATYCPPIIEIIKSGGYKETQTYANEEYKQAGGTGIDRNFVEQVNTTGPESFLYPYCWN